MVIQGFGSVGKHAARFLGGRERHRLSRGVRLARHHFQSQGHRRCPIDCAQRFWKGRHRFPDGQKLDADAVIDIECEIWIPAARPDVIRKDNVARLKTKLVPQGANIPFTAEAERLLHKAGALVIPDFIANAGGVICAIGVRHGGTQSQALQTIEEKIRANTEEVLANAKKSGTLPRQAAIALAEARIKKAMTYRK